MQTPSTEPAVAADLARLAEISARDAAAAAAQAQAVTAEGTYLGAKAARDELREQLSVLIASRHKFLKELEDHDVSGPATTGMQQRIVQLDARIAEMDIAIAKADAAVATAAAVPGAVVEHPSIPRDKIPEPVFFMVPILLTIAMLPIIIAYAIRTLKRGKPAPQQLSADLDARLARIEQMGETTALEVERIGEGQRFVTRLMTDKAEHAVAAGDALPFQR